MSDPDLQRQLAASAATLVKAVRRELPGWVRRSVISRLQNPPPDVLAAADAAAAAAVTAVGEELTAVLAADVDAAPENPLGVLRRAVRYPTQVLRDAGVPAHPRDEFSRRHFPDDDYDLTPAAFADIHPSLQEPGIAWGAAKALVHLRRHRGAGKVP